MNTVSILTPGVVSLRPSYAFLSGLPAAGLVTLALWVPSAAWSADYFNPELLGTGTSVAGSSPLPRVDEQALSRLANGEQLPGTYQVDIWLNDSFQRAANVRFTASTQDGALTPVFSIDDLLSLGVKPEAIQGIDLTKTPSDHQIEGLLEKVPGTQARLLFSQGRLALVIPAIYLQKEQSGAVDPRLWDDGLTAGLLNYSFSGNRNQQRGSEAATGSSDSYFLSLNGGINIGAWRLRNFSTWTHDTKSLNTNDPNNTEPGSLENQGWQAINTYAQRPIAGVKGMLTLGESYTLSDVFDSFQFSGAQLATDDDMFPDVMRNFAPVIRGIANSNARVTVRQNGNVIYETTVAPGTFELPDLTSSSLSGDLVVTVREANGQEHRFVQGYSSVAIMQREGRLKYSLVGGQYRSSGTNSRTPSFAQGTVIYGLPYNLTGYGGGIGSTDYQAMSLGLGVGLGVMGALSADVTHSRATLPDDQFSQGQSYRLRYAKGMTETGTTLTLASFRYSSPGYYSFSDANELTDNRGDITQRPTDGNWTTPVTQGRSRQEFQVNLSQQLEDYGSLSLNGSRQSFWDLSGDQLTASLNYNVTAHQVSYSLGYMISTYPGSNQGTNRQMTFNVQIPLQFWLLGRESTQALWANYGLTHDNTGRNTHSVGVGGSALEDNGLNWGVSQSLTQEGEEGASNSNNGVMNVSYKGSRGTVSGGYSYGDSQRQLNYGLQGGVVATRYGVSLTQPLGETLALVQAPGAAGVRVQDGSGAHTDWRGYTAVSNLQPYRRYQVALDPMTAGDDVTLGLTSQTVTPSRGAVVLARFNTSVGRQMLMTLTRQGKPLPFGTVVSLVQDSSETPGESPRTGIVGDEGQVYLSGMPESGTVKVEWGSGPNDLCRVNYTLPEEVQKTSSAARLPVSLTGVCQ